MRHCRTSIRGGDEQQMNRSFQGHVAWKIDIGAIFQESCIQSRESVARRIRVAAQMRFESTRILCDFAGEARHFDTRRQRIELREFRSEPAIYEHEAASGTGYAERLQVSGADLVRVRRQPERTLRNGADIGEAPVFVSGRRKSS